LEEDGAKEDLVRMSDPHSSSDTGNFTEQTAALSEGSSASEGSFSAAIEQPDPPQAKRNAFSLVSSLPSLPPLPKHSPSRACSTTKKYNYKIIEDWHAVLGDTHSGGRGGNTTTATNILRQVKEDFKTKYRGKKKEAWFRFAEEDYYQRLAEKFPHIPLADRQRILVKCTSQVTKSKRVQVPHSYGFADKGAAYGMARLPAALDFFFKSRDAPALEKEVKKYRRDFDALFASEPLQPPAEMMEDFDETLRFCEAKLEKSYQKRCMATNLVKTLNLIPALKEQWKLLEDSTWMRKDPRMGSTRKSLRESEMEVIRSRSPARRPEDFSKEASRLTPLSDGVRTMSLEPLDVATMDLLTDSFFPEINEPVDSARLEGSPYSFKPLPETFAGAELSAGETDVAPVEDAQLRVEEQESTVKASELDGELRWDYSPTPTECEFPPADLSPLQQSEKIATRGQPIHDLQHQPADSGEVGFGKDFSSSMREIMELSPTVVESYLAGSIAPAESEGRSTNGTASGRKRDRRRDGSRNSGQRSLSNSLKKSRQGNSAVPCVPLEVELNGNDAGSVDSYESFEFDEFYNYVKGRSSLFPSRPNEREKKAKSRVGNLRWLQGAEMLYERAAANGLDIAQFSLGLIYEKRGQFDVARMWYEKAAAQGHAAAENNLGWLYGSGHVGDGGCDLATAKMWYEQAATRGLASAQFSIGLIYEKECRYETAKEWYEKAAAQECTTAQHNLGWLFENGHAGENGCDFEMAKYWYEKAAVHGDAMSQMNLGCLYHAGHEDGDYEKAKIWYKKAASQGHDSAAKTLADLEQSMPASTKKRFGLVCRRESR
jgi:TPR repeat protein